MAKSSTRVAFELPAASHAILEQAAQDNGINVPAAASLILQAALTRRVSTLVPKRQKPVKTGSNSDTAPAQSSTSGAADPDRPAAAGAQ